MESNRFPSKVGDCFLMGTSLCIFQPGLGQALAALRLGFFIFLLKVLNVVS
jgi:hypothetical protein